MSERERERGRVGHRESIRAIIVDCEEYFSGILTLNFYIFLKTIKLKKSRDIRLVPKFFQMTRIFSPSKDYLYNFKI